MTRIQANILMILATLIFGAVVCTSVVLLEMQKQFDAEVLKKLEAVSIGQNEIVAAVEVLKVQVGGLIKRQAWIQSAGIGACHPDLELLIFSWAASSKPIDLRATHRMIRMESSYNPFAISPSGALGLTQLMPLIVAKCDIDPWDPRENLACRLENLQDLLEQHGDIATAIDIDHWGPSRVEAGAFTADYRREVLGHR